MLLALPHVYVRFNKVGFLLFAIAAALLMLPACAQKQEQKPAPPPIEVGVLSVDRGSIDQTLDVSGILKFAANTTISAEVSAQVMSIEVADGQIVDKDQLLLVFDETRIKETANQARATLQKDEATLVFNKTEWEKNLGLHGSGAISQSQYDQKLSLYQNALAQVEADKATLAKAVEDLNKTRVLAPFPGVLSRRYVEKGDWVSVAGNLFQISDFRKIYLEAFVSDKDVGKIDARKIFGGGVDALVTVDTYPGSTFKGRLTYIQPVANQERLFEIRIYMDNPDMMLLQGLFGRVRIVVNSIPDVERVPVEALLGQIRDNSYNNVFVVDQGGKAALNRIKVGSLDSAYAQVLEGLKEGDVVVVRGKEILSSGQPLKTNEMPKPEKTTASTMKGRAYGSDSKLPDAPTNTRKGRFAHGDSESETR